MGNYIKEHIAPKAVIMHRDIHIMPSGCIAGRPSLVAYTGACVRANAAGGRSDAAGGGGSQRLRLLYPAGCVDLASVSASCA
jgi:hypothetical protein